jgi:ribosome-binding protein aMBF1 (putative translation factor)
MPQPKLYAFSAHIEAACAKQFRTFADLAEKLGIDVHELMSQCNGEVLPSKALVKGLARQLNINESFLEKLAEEVRKAKGKMMLDMPEKSVMLQVVQPSSTLHTESWRAGLP